MKKIGDEEDQDEDISEEDANTGKPSLCRLCSNDSRKTAQIDCNDGAVADGYDAAYSKGEMTAAGENQRLALQLWCQSQI